MNEPRHPTHAPFSKEEVALIREAVLTPAASIECPRCGSPLTLAEPTVGETARAKAAAWWLHCATCQRNLIVHDVPRRPSAG